MQTKHLNYQLICRQFGPLKQWQWEITFVLKKLINAAFLNNPWLVLGFYNREGLITGAALCQSIT